MPLRGISGASNHNDIQSTSSQGTTNSSTSSGSSRSITSRSSNNTIDSSRLGASGVRSPLSSSSSSPSKSMMGRFMAMFSGSKSSSNVDSSRLHLTLRLRDGDFGESSTDDDYSDSSSSSSSSSNYSSSSSSSLSNRSATPPPLPPRPVWMSGGGDQSEPRSTSVSSTRSNASISTSSEPDYIDPSEIQGPGRLSSRNTSSSESESSVSSSSSSDDFTGLGPDFSNYLEFGPNGVVVTDVAPMPQPESHSELGRSDSNVSLEGLSDVSIGSDNVFLEDTDSDNRSLESISRNASSSSDSSIESIYEEVDISSIGGAAGGEENIYEEVKIDMQAVAKDVLYGVLGEKEVTSILKPKFPEQVGGKSNTGFVEPFGLVVKEHLEGSEREVFNLLGQFGVWLNKPDPSPENAPEDIQKQCSHAEMKFLANNKDTILNLLPIPLAMESNFSGNTAVAFHDVNKAPDGHGGFRNVSQNGVVDIKIGSIVTARGELELNYPDRPHSLANVRSSIASRFLSGMRGRSIRGFEVVPRNGDLNRIQHVRNPFVSGLGAAVSHLTRDQMLSLDQQVYNLGDVMQVMPMSPIGSSVRIALPEPGDTQTMPKVMLVGLNHTVLKSNVGGDSPVSQEKFFKYKDGFNSGMRAFINVLGKK